MPEIPIGNIIFFAIVLMLLVVLVLAGLGAFLQHRREMYIIKNGQEIQKYYAHNNVGLDILEKAEAFRNELENDTPYDGEILDRQQSGDFDRPGGRWQRNDGRSDG